MLITAPLAPGDFPSLFQGFLPPDLVQAVFEAHGPARRRPPKLPAPDLVAGLVFHSLAGQGRFSTHVQELTSIELSDATLSERRAGLPFMIFEEIAAFLLGYAMLVEHRMKAAAAGQVPVLRISFRQTLAVVRTLWTTLALTGDLLSRAEKCLVVQRALDRIAAQVSAPRRSRSCLRAVRQPVGSWPRLKRNTYQREPVAITVTPVEG